MAIGIAGASLYKNNYRYRNALFALLLFVSVYWFYGKLRASVNYKQASAYAKQTHELVLSHFSQSDQPLHIDTLRASVDGIPVFRLGFKTGLKWLDNSIDTNKIFVQHAVEDNRLQINQ